MKTLIIDNYDSFTFNLYQRLGEIGVDPVVVRNDAITLEGVQVLDPKAIVLSPGPGRPDDPAYFGVCHDVILKLGPHVPILGVCLGHQGIVHALGGDVIRAGRVMHGKKSGVVHEDDPLFEGIPRLFEAMRYHSLIADPRTLPSELEVTAVTADGHAQEVIMAVRHRGWPMWGVQFHPESIGTLHGKRMLENFVRLAG